MNIRLTKALKTFFILNILEGFLPILLYFYPPSMDKNAVIFGLSLRRLVLGSGFAGFWLLLCVFLLYFLLNQAGQKKIISFFEDKLGDPDKLFTVYFSLIYALVALLTIFWLFSADIPIYLNVLEIVYERIFWVLIWFLIVLVQGLILLSLLYKELIFTKGFWNKKIMLKIFVIFSIFGIAVFHWSILFFQIEFFVSIPYWVWHFHTSEANYFIFFLLVIISAGFIYWMVSDPKKTTRNLILLVLLGVIVQVGFGFIAGGGFETLRLKAVNAGHVTYLKAAVDNEKLSQAFTNYEEVYSSDTFLGTKPPGVVIFYILEQKLSTVFSEANDYQTKLFSLSTLNVYLFPLLTFGGLILLYYFARFFLGDKGALYTCILYIFLPNIVLMPMELDIVIFPTVFIVGLLLTRQLIHKRTVIWALALGAYLYFAVYFTFSMLPLIPLCLAWIGLDYWLHRKEHRFWEIVKLGLFVGIGFLIFYILAYFSLNYDPILRYQNAMIKHKTLKEFETGLKQILEALKLNNLELASWIGFPIALLSGVFMVRSILFLLKNDYKPLHVLAAAFFTIYMVLNLAGQTRGEVGRLWTFMDPLFILFAAV